MYDQHCHTNYSLDSTEALENYFEIAQKYNISYLVTTEHIEFNSVYNNQDWTVDYTSLKQELKKLHQKYQNVTPLLGVEIGYRKDYIKEMEQTINSQNFDVVNMSIHDNGVYDYYMKQSFYELSTKKMLEIYFDNIIDALDNFSNFDVLSHFDYGFKTAYTIDPTISILDYETKVRTIFRKLVKLDKALEINVKVQDVINSKNHLKTILKWYKEEKGNKITISSDAHNKQAYEKYYQNINYFKETLKEEGFLTLSYFIKRKEYKYNI